MGSLENEGNGMLDICEAEKVSCTANKKPGYAFKNGFVIYFWCQSLTIYFLFDSALKHFFDGIVSL